MVEETLFQDTQSYNQSYNLSFFYLPLKYPACVSLLYYCTCTLLPIHGSVCFSGCFSDSQASHLSPTVTRWPSVGACQGLCGLHKASQPIPFPGGPQCFSLASVHHVYVLCNCRPQSEQEASVCQNRLVFPSSKG